MFSWIKSECSHANEYATLRKRITELELRCDDLESFQENMRNMARKIQKRKEPVQEEAETEDLKSKILIPV